MSTVSLSEAIAHMVKTITWAEARRGADMAEDIVQHYADSPSIMAGVIYNAGIVEGKRIERAKRRRYRDA